MRPTLVVGFLLIAASVGWVYYQMLPGTFTGDDAVEIRGDIRMKSLDNWLAVAFQGNTKPAWPVGNISFIINRAATGELAQGFVAINILLHGINACCVIWLLACLLRAIGARAIGARAKQSDTAEDENEPGVDKRWLSWLFWSDCAAIAGGLVWAMHPLNTQVVATIYQRHEILMCMFFLLATNQCLAYLQNPKMWRLVTLIGLSALAGFSHLGAVVLPLMPWLLGGAVTTDGRRILRSSLAMLVSPLAVATVIGLQWPLFDSNVIRSDLTPWQYALTQATIMPHYLSLAFYPERQSVAYDWQTALPLSQSATGLAIVLAILFIGLALVRKRWLIGGGLLWLLVTLVPTSSFLPLEPLAIETRMYLPLVGIVITLVGLLAVLAGAVTSQPTTAGALTPESVTLETAATDGIRGGERRANSVAPSATWLMLGSIVLLAAAVAVGLLAGRRATVLRTIEGRWQDALESGYARQTANIQLAGIAMESGDYPAAQDYAKAALEADMSLTSAWTTLANSLSRRGGNVQAVATLNQALEHVEDDGRISLALGNAKVNADPAAAQAHFEQAVALAPNLSEAWNNLGILLARNPETHKRAAECYGRALSIRIDNKQAFLNLSALQLKQGKPYEVACDSAERAANISRRSGNQPPQRNARKVDSEQRAPK